MSSYTALATFVDPADGLQVSAVTGSGHEITYDTDAADVRSGPSPVGSQRCTVARGTIT